MWQLSVNENLYSPVNSLREHKYPYLLTYLLTYLLKGCLNVEQIWKTEDHWRIMEAIHSAPRQSLLLSSLLQQVAFSDVQALTRQNVIRYELDQRRAELVVTFRSKLTLQVFDEIQHSFTRRRGRWNVGTRVVTLRRFSPAPMIFMASDFDRSILNEIIWFWC